MQENGNKFFTDPETDGENTYPAGPETDSADLVYVDPETDSAELVHMNPETDSADLIYVDSETEDAEQKKDLRIVIVWAVIVMVLLVAGVLYLQFRKTRIALNDYVQIRTEGIDTIGKAEYTFDAETFLKDYKETIRFRGGKANTKIGDYTNAAEALLATCVHGSLNKTEDLTNGDTITFMWECDDHLAEEDYHCVLTYSNLDHTVEGLTAAEVFDPFAGITVDFAGTSPNGSAAIRFTSDEEIYHSLQYALSKSSGLMNGEKIRITVSSPEGASVEEATLRAFGKVPSTLEKEVSVEGLLTFVETLSQIPDMTMQELRTKAEEVFNEQEMAGWDGGAKLMNREYLGAYFLTPLLTDEAGTEEETAKWDVDSIIGSLLPSGDATSYENRVPTPLHTPTPTPEPTSEPDWYGILDMLHTSEFENTEQNILYLVYRVDVSLRGMTAFGGSSVFSYYTYTAFSDLQILPDGSVQVDAEAYRVPTGSSVLGVTSGDVVTVRQGFKTYHFSGFASVNDLYMRCVYEKREQYHPESTVET